MYKLKQIPEDFVVKERNTLPLQQSGHYLYLKVKKREQNTFTIVRILAQALNIPEKAVGFAGTKDKRAITEQYISLRGVNKSRIEKLCFPSFSYEIVGYGKTPLSLGDLQGNAFVIVVRNLIGKERWDKEIGDKEIGDKEIGDKEIGNKEQWMPNYFDEQRFGTNNIEVGKHLVKKQFLAAAQLLDDSACREQLAREPNNPLAALQKIPIRLLRLSVNAYQSWLWNTLLTRYLSEKSIAVSTVPYRSGVFLFPKKLFSVTTASPAEKGLSHLQLPLPGFGMDELFPDQLSHNILEILMQEEDLAYSDFIIKQIPPLSAEGGLRRAFVEIEELNIGQLEADELNQGKYKIQLSFFLTKGSYATMAIRSLLKDF